METRHFPTVKAAALAVAVVLLLADAAPAQRFLRGRLRRGRRPYAPAPVYVIPVAPADDAAPEAAPADLPPAYYRPGQEGDAPEELAAPREDAIATFRVLLPTADAALWANGVRTATPGLARELESRPLPEGSARHYVFKARWSQDGREVTATREVDAFAGDRVTVDFTRPAARVGVPEIVPQEAPDDKGG